MVSFNSTITTRRLVVFRSVLFRCTNLCRRRSNKSDPDTDSAMPAATIIQTSHRLGAFRRFEAASVEVVAKDDGAALIKEASSGVEFGCTLLGAFIGAPLVDGRDGELCCDSLDGSLLCGLAVVPLHPCNDGRADGCNHDGCATGRKVGLWMGLISGATVGPSVANMDGALLGDKRVALGGLRPTLLSNGSPISSSLSWRLVDDSRSTVPVGEAAHSTKSSHQPISSATRSSRFPRP
jgi:hypothetical protein